MSRQKWIGNLRIGKLDPIMFACSLHFDKKYWFGKRLLDWEAVPNITSDMNGNFPHKFLGIFLNHSLTPLDLEKPKVKKIYYSYEGMVVDPPDMKIQHYTVPQFGRPSSAPAKKQMIKRIYYNFDDDDSFPVPVSRVNKHLSGKILPIPVSRVNKPLMNKVLPNKVQPEIKMEPIELKQEELTIVDEYNFEIKQEILSAENEVPGSAEVVQFEITEIKTEVKTEME